MTLANVLNFLSPSFLHLQNRYCINSMYLTYLLGGLNDSVRVSSAQSRVHSKPQTSQTAATWIFLCCLQLTMALPFPCCHVHTPVSRAIGTDVFSSWLQRSHSPLSRHTRTASRGSSYQPCLPPSPVSPCLRLCWLLPRLLGKRHMT